MELTTHTSKIVKTASTVTLLAGIWLFISPWVYSVSRLPNAWNSWVVGLAIAALAAIRIGSPAELPGLSWLNCLLGVWTFASPWVFGYTADSGRLVNSLCVGVVVFFMALRSATATPRRGTPLPTGV
jgi:SPW repeat